MSGCEQELCHHWTGHGCACEFLGLERALVAEEAVQAVSWKSTENALNTLADEVATHVQARWGADDFTQVAKVAEEAGEAIGAAIKYRQGRVPVTHIGEELADVLLAALAAAHMHGYPPDELIRSRWEEVKQR